MAKNTGKGSRKGSVTNRTQTKAPNGNWVKRSRQTGQFMNQKSGGEPFKGVAKEKDGRRIMAAPEPTSAPPRSGGAGAGQDEGRGAA